MADAPIPDWKSRRVGERLARYVLGHQLGAGGAASVHLARLAGPHGFERFLALKIVHQHLLVDEQFVAMFLDEANLSAQLSHPNIVHTYEFGLADGQPFIAMEYLAGKPLSQVYARAFQANEPLEYALVAWMGARAADALHYAHELKDANGRSRALVHRDISPDNLFVTYDGDIKVIDFGIARAEGRIAHTDYGQVKGKFRYMAPEYALGQSFDHTLDLFALGASLYEAALGRVAFDDSDRVRSIERLLQGRFTDPKELRPDFPDALAHVLTTAMNPERHLRYATGRRMSEALDPIAGLSAAEARARLAKHMQRAFARERAREAEYLNELRAIHVQPVQEETTPLNHALRSTLPAPPAARTRWIAVGAAATLAIAFVTAVASRSPLLHEPAAALAQAGVSPSPAELHVAAPVFEPRALPHEPPSSVRMASNGAAPAPSAAAPVTAISQRAQRANLATAPISNPTPNLKANPIPNANPNPIATRSAERTDVIRANPFADAP